MITYSRCAGNPFYREMALECLVHEELRKPLFSWTKNKTKCAASNFTFTIDLWSEHLCFIMACDCDSVTPPMVAMTFYISCLHPFGNCWPAKCEGIFQKHGNGSNSQRISFSLKTHKDNVSGLSVKGHIELDKSKTSWYQTKNCKSGHNHHVEPE